MAPPEFASKNHRHLKSPRFLLLQVPSVARSERLILSDQKANHFVEFDHLVRVQGNGSYCQFMMINNESIVTSKHLKIYEELLESRGFIRTHQSHMVNISHVAKFQKAGGGSLLMSNDDLVDVSQRYHQNVLMALGLGGTKTKKSANTVRLRLK